MDWISWDDTLRTGDASMDAAHRGLVELFNLLADAVEKRKGKGSYAKVLDNIIEHAKTHFALEEQLMAEHRYPKSEQHKAEHAMLIDQALNYRATFEADSASSPVAVTRFAEVWLAFHILFSDKELAVFLARDA
jgi:hemerythrin